MTFKKPKSLPGSVIELASDPANDSTYTINAGSLWLDIGSSPAVLYERNSGNTGWNAVGSGGGSSLPTQDGNSGKYLTTNGSALSWSSLSTSDVSEGTNLYWTTTRFDDRLASASLPAANLTGSVADARLSANIPKLDAVSQNFTGNIGLDEASPSEKLHVNGNVKATKFDGQLPSRSFAQLNVIGDLPAHVTDGGIHDFYLNTEGAKTLRKITVTCLSTPASGTVVVDVKITTAQGGASTSLFPTKTKPTLTCANGLAWTSVTGENLDTTAIPDNCVVSITVTSAASGSADLRVELFE